MANNQTRVKVDGCRCLRCGAIWVPKRNNPNPLRCGVCKTPYWNIPEGQKYNSEKKIVNQ